MVDQVIAEKGRSSPRNQFESYGQSCRVNKLLPIPSQVTATEAGQTKLSLARANHGVFER